MLLTEQMLLLTKLCWSSSLLHLLQQMAVFVSKDSIPDESLMDPVFLFDLLMVPLLYIFELSIEVGVYSTKMETFLRFLTFSLDFFSVCIVCALVWRRLCWVGRVKMRMTGTVRMAFVDFSHVLLCVCTLPISSRSALFRREQKFGGYFFLESEKPK